MTSLRSSVMRITLLFCCFTYTTITHAQSLHSNDSPEQECFAIAMVGFDSVINSRLGVLPENVIDLARTQQASLANANETDKQFAPFLLNVILGAYLWKESPHNYAVRVIFRCASEQPHLPLQAKADYNENLYPLMR